MPLLKSPKVATTRLQLPVGTAASEPANAEVGTLGYDLENDVVRVKTTDGWEDIGGGGAGGGGLITRTDKQMPALVTTTDGQLACSGSVSSTPASDCYVGVRVNGVDISAIGNGTKTNADCYFSNDGGVTARAWTAIAVGDQLYWQGSIAGYQLATTDIVEFVYEAPVDPTTGEVVVPVSIESSPYQTKPPSPHAFNDEFDEGSADLVARGWGIWNSSTNYVPTYAGPIQVWSSTSGNGFAGYPAGGTYRASIVGSCLFIQVPSGGQYHIYRPLVAAEGTLLGRFWTTASWDAGGNSSGMNLISMGRYPGTTVPTGVPAPVIQTYNGTNGDNVIRNSTGVDVGTLSWGYGGSEAYFMRWPAQTAATYYFGWVNSNGVAAVQNNGGAGYSASVSQVMAGFTVSNTATGIQRHCKLVVIDYIRFLPGNQWLCGV